MPKIKFSRKACPGDTCCFVKNIIFYTFILLRESLLFHEYEIKTFLCVKMCKNKKIQ